MTGRVISIGVLTPHAAIGPEAELPTMAPERIMTHVARVSGPSRDGAGRTPSSALDLRALTAPPFLDDAAEFLTQGSIDVLGYASTSSAYAIGFDGEAAMVSRLSRRAGVPVVATCTSAVLALRVLDVERIALVHPPWFDDELNELGASYFRSQGFRVVMSTSAGVSRDPDRIELAGVIEWMSRHVEADAEAVFIGGNGFRVVGAIEALEVALGRPVLQSNQVLLWNALVRADATFRIRGYGQLFAHEPPADVP